MARVNARIFRSPVEVVGNWRRDRQIRCRMPGSTSDIFRQHFLHHAQRCCWPGTPLGIVGHDVKSAVEISLVDPGMRQRICRSRSPIPHYLDWARTAHVAFASGHAVHIRAVAAALARLYPHLGPIAWGAGSLSTGRTLFLLAHLDQRSARGTTADRSRSAASVVENSYQVCLPYQLSTSAFTRSFS